VVVGYKGGESRQARGGRGPPRTNIKGGGKLNRWRKKGNVAGKLKREGESVRDQNSSKKKKKTKKKKKKNTKKPTKQTKKKTHQQKNHQTNTPKKKKKIKTKKKKKKKTPKNPTKVARPADRWKFSKEKEGSR